MIWWRNRLHKCRRISIELVAVVALLGSKEMISGDEVLIMKCILGIIDSSGGGPASGITDDALCRDAWMACLVVCLWEVLMVRDACLDPGVGQNLSTTDTPPLSLSPEGSRLIWPWVGKLRRRLHSEGSSHSEPSLKTGEDSCLINNQNLYFMMNEIVQQERIKFG